MPARVIERAKEILAQLEGSQGNRGDSFQAPDQGLGAVPLQMGLFGALENRLRDQLSQLDVARMTPIEALNLLHKLTEEAKK
jgi:DNA mismatch repair ATPase MutS